MKLDEITLTLEDLQNCGWRSMLPVLEAADCHLWFRELNGACGRAEAEGRDSDLKGLWLLSAVASLRLNLDQANPLVSRAEFDGLRLPSADDFTEEQLDLMRVLAPGFESPLLRARFCDILWHRRRDHELAALAVQSYLDGAKLALSRDGEGSAVEESLERALQLAALLGKKKPLYAQVLTAIEEIISDHNSQVRPFLAARLMEVLIERHAGDPAKFATLCESRATAARSAGMYPAERTYWHLAAQWHRLAESVADERQTVMELAESFVREAEARTGGPDPSFLAASQLIGCGIHTLRSVSGTKARAQELQKLLEEYQERGLAEMKPISGGPIDITRMVEAAETRVHGKSPEEALMALATVGRPLSRAACERIAERQISTTPLRLALGGQVMNAMGRVITRTTPLHPGSDDARKMVIQEQAWGVAATMWAIQAHGTIEPARQTFVREHHARVRDLLQVTRRSPFVPPGREFAFARGLVAGFEDDWITAAHLLVNQIEHALRGVLASRGLITCAIDVEGIQAEFGLNSLLTRDEHVAVLTDVFGPDLVFSMRALLIEKHGANLRHDIDHGLIGDGAYYGPAVRYLWWLVVHLCCVPLIARDAGTGDTEAR